MSRNDDVIVLSRWRTQYDITRHTMTMIRLTPMLLGDYCDVYLTHDSRTVRQSHNEGKNHLRNVVDYYQRM